MLRRQFGQIAVTAPAAGLLAAHRSHMSELSKVAAGSATLTTAFTNPVTTIAATWLVASPSGDTSGATDTKFLNSTLSSLSSQYLGASSLWLAPGIWYVSGPITPLAGQRISGLLGSTQSGDGAASDEGTVIRAVGSSSWPTTTTNGTSTNGLQSVFAYPSALDQGELTDLWIDCSQFTGGGLSGVAALGAVDAISLQRVGVYEAPTDGFMLAESSGNVPDGWYLDTCLAQTCGGDGFTGYFTDGTLINCHAQNCGGDGFVMQGGNAKLLGCRGDLCTNGFTIDVAGSSTSGFNDATMLTGCGTQRNSQDGLNVINSSSTGDAYRNPVVVEGCTFGGDGYNGGDLSGVYYAGIRVRGANTVFIGSTSVTVHQLADGNAPLYGLTIGEMGSTDAYPLLVTVATGLLNGATAPVHNGSNSATTVQFGNGVYGATAFQPTTFTQLQTSW
jgi:hypothetical protein